LKINQLESQFMAWGGKSGDVSASARGSGGTLSFIGSEVTITGNITGRGDIHLDGTINGDVQCQSLILGQGGHIRGNIDAEKATIAGSVEGTVGAGSLVIEKSARVSGDLAYDSLSIETGAQVDGRMGRRTGGVDVPLKLVSAAE
jgi:cytoskeletal protein CcmA (bactofilin family)